MKNKKKIALITVISILAVFFLVLMPVLTVLIYHDKFGERFETAEWMAYSADDFEGLQVSECTFPSNNGQLLAGYQYSKENQEKKGVVVIAHGLGGGGHNTYMDIADYFTSNGYLVFAYDATGNDKSEGESVIGSGMKLFMPYASLYERLKFGKYASYSAIDGFAASNAGIMVICSRDDTTVLPENGYDKFYEVYGNDPRFCFVEYEDRGHNYIYYSQASQRYREQLNEDYTGYVEANGGEYNAQIKTEFMGKYLDKSKCYELDYDLMQQILGFYDSYCEPAGGR